MGSEAIGIDAGQFDQIFLSWYGKIRNFIYYKTGDIQVAEDIAQDTFIKIWEKRDEVKPETVKSLLYTIANNLFLNRIEHQKVVLSFANSVPLDQTTTSPEYELEMNEFGNVLQQALSDLDEDKRSVFLMNRMDDLTYNQIAENLGISVKAVEKRMNKALIYLRKHVGSKI
jgi:RNA polymerase sigma-70 factor (family 1)